MQSQYSTELVELVPIALYGAEDDDDSADDDASQEDDTKPVVDKFSQEYVDKLRKEAAGYRVSAKESKTLLEEKEAELAKIRQAEMNDLEIATTSLEAESLKVAELEARAVSAEANLKTVTITNAVTLSAIEAGFEDPTDALSMISQDDLIDDEGSISTKTVKARLKALADKKPYLLKTHRPGSGDGGPTGEPADQDTFEAKQAAYLKEMTTTGGRIPA